MSDATPEPMDRLARHRRLQSAMEIVLGKLRLDAKSISTDDVERLTDNAAEADVWTAQIIAAVADLAIRNEDANSILSDEHSSIDLSRVVNLSQAVETLHAAVKVNPGGVNTDILRTTQTVVSMMQKAIGHTNAPHPELEAELQQEYAKIVPKVESGIVTKAEADHLHSLEARAHSHTARGGLTAIAQSVAAKRERRASISSASSNVKSRSNSHNLTPQKQSHNGADAISSKDKAIVTRVKIEAIEPSQLCQQEAHSPEKNSGKSLAKSPNASTRRVYSLSESTNATRGESMHELHKCGSTDMEGGAETDPRTRKNENSHPAK